jgi:O-antigen ligase
MAGQQLPLSASPAQHDEAFGPALLVGLFLGFHLFVLILAVWISEASPQAGAAADIALNLLIFTAVAFACLGNGSRPADFLRTSPSRWALAFLIVSCCSLTWTVAASMAAAVAFWSVMAADVAMAVLLLRVQPPEIIAPSLLRGFAYGAAAVAVIAWLLPATSDSRLGYEGLMGPNQVGFLCAFAFFCAQYLVLIRGEKHTFVMILLSVTMLRSLSKTTIIAFLLSQTLLLATGRNIPRRTKVLVTIGALVIVLLFSSLLFSYFDYYADTGQAETVSGRLGIWAVMFLEAIQKPWFGHGFHSVWKVIPPYGADAFEIRHAHNELLQQFYAYGAVGIALFFGIYISFYRQIRRLVRGPLRSFLLSFLVFILIRGLADTDAFDLSLPLWCIILFSAVMQRAAATDPVADLQTRQSPRASLAGSEDILPTC